MAQVTLIAHDQTAAVAHPTKATLHFPPLAPARPSADGATPPRLSPLPAFKRRNGWLDTALAQRLAKPPAIVGLVGHKSLRAGAWPSALLRHAHHGQRLLRQLTLMGLGTIDMQSNRQAISIGNHHDFGAFANFRLAYFGPPFLAGTKLPSKNAWAHSILFCASNWPNKARQRHSHVPSADHSCSHRQQVMGEPNSRGTTAQAQPVFSTYRIPFSVRRPSFRGRPGPGFCFGISGSMTAHFSSVKSCRLMPQVYHSQTQS